MSLLEDINNLYEYVRRSRREYTGVRWTKNDPYGRVERRVRERPRVKRRDLFRAAHNRKVKRQRKRKKNCRPPIKVFGKKLRS